MKHVVLIVSQLPQITCNPSELNDSHPLPEKKELKIKQQLKISTHFALIDNNAFQ